MCFQTDGAVNGDIYLIGERGNEIPLTQKDGKINFNITNITKGDMLPDGVYRLFCNGKFLKTDDELLGKLDDVSRVFKYAEGFYALVVSFSVDEDYSLVINVDYMMRNKNYKKRLLLCEGKGLKGKTIVLTKKLSVAVLNIFYRFLRLFKFKRKKTVLFFSENSNEPIGNLNALYEYMKQNTAITVKGSFFDMHGKKQFIKIANAVKNIALSDAVVLDNYSSLINVLSFSRKQKIVQLWHAGVGFKAVGYARFGKVGGPHPFKSSHRKYDIVIVDDERLVDIYKEVFGVGEDSFRAYGMPRLQGFFSQERIARVSASLFKGNPLLKNKRVILFSPTYRGATADDAFYDYRNIDLKRIYWFCKQNGFCFIIKMHPFIKQKINIPKDYSDLVFDYSDYDINDLIYISDIMITDYSSCAYEFSFFGRPLVFYRFDKSLYEYTRPVHTLDAFSPLQFQVEDFDTLMSVLETLTDKVTLQGRFDNFKARSSNSCELISNEILRCIE